MELSLGIARKNSKPVHLCRLQINSSSGKCIRACRLAVEVRHTLDRLQPAAATATSRRAALFIYSPSETSIRRPIKNVVGKNAAFAYCANEKSPS